MKYCSSYQDFAHWHSKDFKNQLSPKQAIGKMGYRYSRWKLSVEHIIHFSQRMIKELIATNARWSCATVLKSTSPSCVLHQGTRWHCIHKTATCARSIWTRYSGVKGIDISCQSVLLHHRLISFSESLQMRILPPATKPLAYPIHSTHIIHIKTVTEERVFWSASDKRKRALHHLIANINILCIFPVVGRN